MDFPSCLYKKRCNPVIDYLNLNHFGSKIDDVRDTWRKLPIVVKCIDETKSDSSYHDPQLKISGYQYPPYRKNRNKYGGGKIVFLREALMAKRVRDFEGDTTEIICLELTTCKKIWCIIFACRSTNNNKYIFFSELSNFLNRVAMKYDNLLVIGDLNIDTLIRKKIIETIFLIYVTLPITDITCVKSINGSSVDVLLTNKSRSFHHTAAFGSALSDCHKMILTFFRAHFKKSPHKDIEYRNLKKLLQI